MNDFADHIRIFEPTPDDDFVTKREAAIKSVTTKLNKKRNFDELLAVANEVSTALFDLNTKDSAICQEITAALKAKSPSFSENGNTLQVAVCSALSVLKLLRDANPVSGRITTSIFLAFALWSGLAHRPPLKEGKLEALRQAIVCEARELTLEAAETARRRASVPDFELTAQVASEPSEEDTTLEEFNTSAKATIDALRTNAALDREELDLLWWVLGDWSDIAKSRISSLSNSIRPVVSGIELSQKLRRVPGDAHLHLILRVLDEDKEVTLKKLLTDLDGLKSTVADFYAKHTRMEKNRAVFPLLHAICFPQQQSTLSGEKLKSSDWAARALAEASILRMIDLPASLS